MSSVFGNTLLIFGPEGLLAERAAEQRVAAALRERPEAQVNRIEASELNDNQLAEITGGSLFSSDSITVINDIGSMPPNLIDAVLRTATSGADELCLVLIHGGGVKGRGLLNKLKQAKLETAEANSIKPWKLAGFVTEEARRRRVIIQPEAAESLVAAVGSDLRALAGAVDQLASDTDGTAITAELVGKYFSGRTEVTSFAVADAVLAGDARVGLERLRWALGTGVAPVLVTSAVASGLRSLARFLDQRGDGLSDYDLAREIGVPPFKIKELRRNSRGWTPDAVAAAIQAVALADAQVKGAATDPGYALERMVLTVIAQRR